MTSYVSTVRQLYEEGYALPQYGVFVHAWRHFDDEIMLPHGAVAVTEHYGIPCALWADVVDAKRRGTS